jgi:hypothetical protein
MSRQREGPADTGGNHDRGGGKPADVIILITKRGSLTVIMIIRY